MKTFAAQMIAYFGRLPNQTAASFGAELKALNDKEKLEFWSMLQSNGYPCLKPGESSK